MAIKRWEQVDGDHFRGLCQNEFWPVISTGAGGCNVCVSPIQQPIPACGCPGVPKVVVPTYKTYYMRVNAEPLTSLLNRADPDPCWASLLIGDFILNYSAGGSNKYDWNVGGFLSNELTVALFNEFSMQETCISPGGIAVGNPSLGVVPRAPRFVGGVTCSSVGVQFWTWRVSNQFPAGWTIGDDANPLTDNPPKVTFTSSAEICTNRRSRRPLYYTYFEITPAGTQRAVQVQVGEFSTHPFT